MGVFYWCKSSLKKADFLEGWHSLLSLGKGWHCRVGMHDHTPHAVLVCQFACQDVQRGESRSLHSIPFSASGFLGLGSFRAEGRAVGKHHEWDFEKTVCYTYPECLETDLSIMAASALFSVEPWRMACLWIKGKMEFIFQQPVLVYFVCLFGLLGWCGQCGGLSCGSDELPKLQFSWNPMSVDATLLEGSLSCVLTPGNLWPSDFLPWSSVFLKNTELSFVSKVSRKGSWRLNAFPLSQGTSWSPGEVGPSSQTIQQVTCPIWILRDGTEPLFGEKKQLVFLAPFWKEEEEEEEASELVPHSSWVPAAPESVLLPDCRACAETRERGVGVPGSVSRALGFLCVCACVKMYVGGIFFSREGWLF